jgi:hypothetical protein
MLPSNPARLCSCAGLTPWTTSIQAEASTTISTASAPGRQGNLPAELARQAADRAVLLQPHAGEQPQLHHLALAERTGGLQGLPHQGVVDDAGGPQTR